jgi:hypothetical protein
MNGRVRSGRRIKPTNGIGRVFACFLKTVGGALRVFAALKKVGSFQLDLRSRLEAVIFRYDNEALSGNCKTPGILGAIQANRFPRGDTDILIDDASF